MDKKSYSKSNPKKRTQNRFQKNGSEKNSDSKIKGSKLRSGKNVIGFKIEFAKHGFVFKTLDRKGIQRAVSKIGSKTTP